MCCAGGNRLPSSCGRFPLGLELCPERRRYPTFFLIKGVLQQKHTNCPGECSRSHACERLHTSNECRRVNECRRQASTTRACTHTSMCCAHAFTRALTFCRTSVLMVSENSSNSSHVSAACADSSMSARRSASLRCSSYSGHLYIRYVVAVTGELAHLLVITSRRHMHRPGHFPLKHLLLGVGFLRRPGGR